MNRKKAPAIKDAIQYDLTLKPCGRIKLPNGVPVYTIHAGSQEVVQVEWVFYAGNSYEKMKGVAAATNFLLKNGTSGKTAYQINEIFDYYGAWCNRSCNHETAVITLHCLTRHLSLLLPLVKELLTDALFTVEELDIYKQNAKQRLEVNLRKCEFVAGRLINGYLYGTDHPYGVYTSPGDIDALDTGLLKEFYATHYLQGHCAMFVSGFLPPGLEEQLSSLFSSSALTGPPATLPFTPASPATDRTYRVTNDARAVQGAIRLGMPFPGRHHPDYNKAIVLNNLFGGFFGSRLMRNIREDKGYTYGIYSYIQHQMQQSAWVISTEAGKDVCEATIKEVYNEMKRLRDEPIDNEELLLVRNYLIGVILGDLDGPFQIMGKWKNIILNNLDEKYFYESVRAIKTVSAEEIQLLAEKYLQPEHFYELVVY